VLGAIANFLRALSKSAVNTGALLLTESTS
jgi:hypothetical protein